jgi:hypothetical protein
VARSISPEVRRFVAERIHSVAQLELLLMLHRDPGVEWTAEAAAREMRYPTDWAAAELLSFRRAGLVGARGLAYRFRARSALAGVVDELAETFARRRSTVTALIFSGAGKDVQCFSDAFRVARKEE